MPDSIGKRDISTMRPAARTRQGGLAAGALIAILLVLAVIGAAAWWFLVRPGQVATAPASPSATQAPAAADAAATAAAVDAPVADTLSVNDLYKEARAAMSENRMVSPPGKNALEYYLAILARQPDDTGATDALRELFPFATGSAEEQINSGDFAEADRIMNLLAKADPFTEPVVAKGDKKLYRARFAGLDRDQAEAVCKTLKRSDISCMTIRN